MTFERSFAEAWARFPRSCKVSNCFSKESRLFDFPTLVTVSFAFLATVLQVEILWAASKRNSFIWVVLCGLSSKLTSASFCFASETAASKVFKVRLARPSKESIPLLSGKEVGARLEACVAFGVFAMPLACPFFSCLGNADAVLGCLGASFALALAFALAGFALLSPGVSLLAPLTPEDCSNSKPAAVSSSSEEVLDQAEFSSTLSVSFPSAPAAPAAAGTSAELAAALLCERTTWTKSAKVMSLSEAFTEAASLSLACCCSVCRAACFFAWNASSAKIACCPSSSMTRSSTPVSS